MTTGEMLQWTKRFKGIVNGPANMKNSRLTLMFDDLCEAHPNDDPYAVKLQTVIFEARDGM